MFTNFSASSLLGTSRGKISLCATGMSFVERQVFCGITVRLRRAAAETVTRPPDRWTEHGKGWDAEKWKLYPPPFTSHCVASLFREDLRPDESVSNGLRLAPEPQAWPFICR